MPASSRKVMVVVEENKTYGEILGSARAPYLTRVSRRYGSATAYRAGYPARCPSLAAYVLMTSGTTHGICDDRDATAHRLGGPNLFQQVASSGRQWRGYGESMPRPCETRNRGRYVPRHLPAPYYTSEAKRCPRWDLPLGDTARGSFRDDVTSGRLPAFSFVAPDVCHDMHGGITCAGDDVSVGDAWLATWLPRILDGPDYRAGRLTVIITWDEGSSRSNHVPTLVVSPTTSGVRAARAFTHCSLLATVEDLLAVPALGCAASAPSMRTVMRLR